MGIRHPLWNTMNRLGLFAKFWTPGRVKTRLAQTVGDQSAAEIHKALLLHLLRELSGLKRGPWVVNMDLVFTPSEDREKLEPFCDQWRLVPQCEGDLGRRLATYVTDAFSSGDQRVVLIGADCPFVSGDLIEEAFRRLDSADVVLGPALDGGYYLLGLAHPTVQLFENIEWSTDRVLEQTMAIVSDSQLVHLFLPKSEDVDDFDSLRRIASELKFSAPGTGKHDLADELDRLMQVSQ
ncbi:MAG: TIGR04282 family arsenosugar biosynthesis glycosyltransferase [Pirellulaceae bacterium]